MTFINLFGLGMIWIVQIGLVMFLVFLFVAQVIGAPFKPSSDERLKKMIKLARLKKKDVIIDLGSGDGKILMALGRRGYKAEGVEINPMLVLLTKLKIRLARLNNRVRVRQGNIWTTDLSGYNVVFLYGIPGMMGRLEKKLRKELKPQARVVSNCFEFASLKEKKRDGEVILYVL